MAALTIHNSHTRLGILQIRRSPWDGSRCTSIGPTEISDATFRLLSQTKTSKPGTEQWVGISCGTQRVEKLPGNGPTGKSIKTRRGTELNRKGPPNSERQQAPPMESSNSKKLHEEAGQKQSVSRGEGQRSKNSSSRPEISVVKYVQFTEFASELRTVSSSEGEMCWRLFGVEVPLLEDPGKDDVSLHEALHAAVAARLGSKAQHLPPAAISILRKSFDARMDPKFVYAVDVDAIAAKSAMKAAGTSFAKLNRSPKYFPVVPKVQAPSSLPDILGLENFMGQPFQGPADLNAESQELADRRSSHTETSAFGIQTKHVAKSAGVLLSDGDQQENKRSMNSGLQNSEANLLGPTKKLVNGEKGNVVVVGTGPAGLFAALSLAVCGHRVTLVERGQPVEVRGRDIGAFVVRRQLNSHSNFCYGEGGAGTWSDGKLTTRIGKNSSDVQAVLRTLVQFGAPGRICIDGKPHLGTDRLVLILRNFRKHLLTLGVDIHFGTEMDDLEIHNGKLVGVRVGAVHSLPQKSSPAGSRGYKSGTTGLIKADKVILAVGHSARETYQLLQRHGVQMSMKDFAVGFRVEHPQEVINRLQYGQWESAVERGKGKIPVADYSLAAEIQGIDEEDSKRGCYSFCMCPGGQVVCTSTNEEELCLNGMSFSKRGSKWANSALVATVSSKDFAPFIDTDGAMAGLGFQRAIEREAAIRGGGSFRAPVQRVTDFLDGRLSASPLPSSSYRLGVNSAALHDLYPSDISTALHKALLVFERQMPGFICSEALLHGVETRTSAPVRVDRDKETYESLSLPGLCPIGEGAGYAGGIVSAAVDGLKAGLAIGHRLVRA